MEIGNDRRNSRIALLAVALFLLFDFAALALNFLISYRIEEQAVGINLAGRQRMLSQRMVKVLLQMENHLERGSRVPEDLAELRITFDLFDNTLQGFDHGMLTRGGSGEILFLPPVKGSAARIVVADAVSLWQPYRRAVLKILDAGPAVDPGLVRDAVAFAALRNLKLLEDMNQLTTELERQTRKEASEVRFYQASAFILALLNFVWAFRLYWSRIREFGKSHNLLDEMINKISATVLVLDVRDRILKANHTAETVFGYSREELFHLKLGDLITGHDSSLTGHRKDGTTFLASMQRSDAVLNDQSFSVVTLLDVTSQRKTEEHLSSLAYHDLLTRLPNRLLFTDRLAMELAHAQRRGTAMAVMFVDLDRFKPVNDTHGHEVGDHLLQDAAVRLRRCLRETDTVARRGGDEFTIIATDVGGREHAATIAGVILGQIARPFHVQGITIQISCSIGISMFPDDGSDPELLVRYADEAMYDAKQSGRNTFKFYR